jgi:hypothetical protein
VWVVVKEVTFALNPIVSTCVLNQSRGHWLLLDTLTITVTLIMNMEIKLLQLFSSTEIFDLFEVKILVLHRNM